MDPDTAGGEKGPLADLTSPLGGDGFGADGIVVREHPSGGWRMHTLCNLVGGTTMEERGGPVRGIRPGSC